MAAWVAFLDFWPIRKITTLCQDHARIILDKFQLNSTHQWNLRRSFKCVVAAILDFRPTRRITIYIYWLLMRLIRYYTDLINMLFTEAASRGKQHVDQVRIITYHPKLKVNKRFITWQSFLLANMPSKVTVNI